MTLLSLLRDTVEKAVLILLPQTPVMCSAEMCRMAIPWYRPAVVLGCRQGWGMWANLPRFQSQPLPWGFQATCPPGLPSRMPFTLSKLRAILGTNLAPLQGTFLQAYSPAPRQSPDHCNPPGG